MEQTHPYILQLEARIKELESNTPNKELLQAMEIITKLTFQLTKIKLKVAEAIEALEDIKD